MIAIGRIEADHRAFPPEVFERGFLVVDQRDDDLAVTRNIGAPDKRVIPVQYAGLHHGVARNLQRIMFSAAEQGGGNGKARSEEHTSELQSLMRISYAVFCLKKKRENAKKKHNSRT